MNVPNKILQEPELVKTSTRQRRIVRKNIFVKPHHFNVKSSLSWYDRLCISKLDAPCRCMEVNQWYKKDPAAVMIDNVVNGGALLRRNVYRKFARKLAGVKFYKEREVLRNLVSLKAQEKLSSFSKVSN